MGVSRRLAWQALLVAGITMVLLPLVVLAADAFSHPASLWEFLVDSRQRAAWWMSLRLSVAAATVATLLAAPLAVLSTRTDVPGAGAMTALARLPLALPSYLLAMAWLRLWQPRSGLLSSAGLAVDLATPLGCALILGLAELPIVLMPLEAALRRADPATEEAARMAGAGPLRALWDASLRPALPSLATGAALAASSALAAFGVPLLLGTAGTEPFSVMTTAIYEQILIGTEGARQKAATIAVWLAVTSSIFTVLSALAARRVSRQAQGKPGRPRVLALRSARIPAGIVAWAMLLLLLVAPLIALAISSLQPVPGTPPSEWSLRAHELLMSRRGLLEAVGRSLLLAGGAASACIMCAVVLAVLVERMRLGTARAASAVLSWPYVLPGSVLALALILALSRPVRVVVLDRLSLTLLIAGTSWMLLMAYVLKHAAVAVRPISVAMRSIGPSLDEAARIFGAGAVRAFVTGTAHALRPMMSSGFITVFLLCFSELTLSVLLVGPDTEVVGTVLFELHSYASPAESAALASWMTVVAVVGFALAARRTSPGQ